MKTVTASGIFCINCLAPCTSMSSTKSRSRPRARLLVPTATLAQHLQNQLAREGCALLVPGSLVEISKAPNSTARSSFALVLSM